MKTLIFYVQYYNIETYNLPSGMLWIQKIFSFWFHIFALQVYIINQEFWLFFSFINIENKLTFSELLIDMSTCSNLKVLQVLGRSKWWSIHWSGQIQTLVQELLWDCCWGFGDEVRAPKRIRAYHKQVHRFSFPWNRKIGYGPL